MRIKSLCVSVSAFVLCMPCCLFSQEGENVKVPLNAPKEIASFEVQTEATTPFINYFELISNEKALEFIHSSLSMLLKRINLAYVGDEKLHNKDFFIKLEALIQRHDKNIKVYIAGGVVRSLLGYVYKKLYNTHQTLLA